MNEQVHQNLKEFTLSFERLYIKSEHVRNAMGRYKQGTQGPFPGLILKAINDVAPQIKIRGGYRYCKNVNYSHDRSTIQIENSTFSVGGIIGNQIKGADSIAVFVCTIGSRMSELSKIYMERGDMIQGYILDTIGSVAVEKGMDAIQENLAVTERRKGRKITNRFSPGYCDWHLGDQKKLFSLLPDNFCGITLLESAVMLPLKSVSGIIGIGKKVKLLDYPCKICESQNCFRRRVGD